MSGWKGILNKLAGRAESMPLVFKRAPFTSNVIFPGFLTATVCLGMN